MTITRRLSQAAIEAESIGWLPLGDGAYLHVGDPEGDVITVVGVVVLAMLAKSLAVIVAALILAAVSYTLWRLYRQHRQGRTPKLIFKGK